MVLKGPFFRIVQLRIVNLHFTKQSRLLTTLKRKALENTMGKGENAGNQHFLLFPTVFSTLSKREIIILIIFNMSSAKAFNFDKSNILSFGKELKVSK